MKINKLFLFFVLLPVSISLVVFGVMFLQSDQEGILGLYRSTKKSDLFNKDQQISSSTLIEEANKARTRQGLDPYTTPVPDDLSPASITTWVNSLDMAPERKAMIIKGLSMYQKGFYSCTSRGHNNWVEPDLTGKPIECSGFVAWIHKHSGIDENQFGVVADIDRSSRLEVVQQGLPGDIAWMYEGGIHHTGIWLGKQANGNAIYLHAGGHTRDANPTPLIGTSNHLRSDRFKRHPKMKEYDEAYYASANNPAMNTGGIDVANAVVPDDLSAESITNYINSLNISQKRKTVLLSLPPVFKTAPYKWGGEARSARANESIAGRYIDCTGIITWAYNHIGIEIYGFYTGGMASYGFSQINDPIPGDVVRVPGHAEIYLGKNAAGQVVSMGIGSGMGPYAIINSKFQRGDCYWRHPAVAADDAYVQSSGNIGQTSQQVMPGGTTTVSWNSSWQWARLCKNHDPSVTIYHPTNPNGKVVALDPGHGMKNGHMAANHIQAYPNGEAISTSGTNQAGATTRQGASTGTSMGDGSGEGEENLKVALKTKDKLLAAGYSVMMLRETNTSNQDNIARAIYASNGSNLTVSIHFNSDNSQGKRLVIFVPNSTQRQRMGASANLAGIDKASQAFQVGFPRGGWPIKDVQSTDLAFHAYNSIPCIMLEMGAARENYTDADRDMIAASITEGVKEFFK